MSTAPRPLTARERARIEFTRDIKEAARRQLAEHGAAGISLRGVARDIGLVSASALYRYFPGRDALLTALIADSYTSLGNAADAAAALDAEPPAGGDHLGRWVAVCHAVRDWALAHPHEYALIHGSPVPGYTAPEDTVEPGTRVPFLIGALFARAAQDGAYRPLDRLPVPADAHRALVPLLGRLPEGIPDDLVVAGLTAWTYLFGAVSFEAFGHRANVVADPQAYFDHEVRRLGVLLGLGPSVADGGRPSGPGA
ncbi:TetR/AcrR family transcriptional regulator [Kitasatospora sp. NBC_00240]|uniref:TetR/AcrR family transcriptional regulator n=1 Tax=Kitasatospora sp. NBC_00240 TaxID=2903567 RepID=UPI0022508245|nr:TetR/AcrR family transcriptional regulator [Kitasatospora sp. NBC_00240]MCX5208921.1 TetR/AcrR family transcriptional regulator [Kitasatospora sp. NBC_00240]